MSPLILFHSMDEFNLLYKFMVNLITTAEIAGEFGEVLPNLIKTQSTSDKKYQAFLNTQVDYGEASALALAFEFDDVLLLLDDLKARKLATKLKFNITGALGVIHKAKQTAIIDKIKSLIEKLILIDFCIADNIIKEILKLNIE
ncbi:MAG: DUF3368 domain-containing protein [bacterium]|nr:DUF3368 domain-containing protein [bacterium]